MSDFTKRYFPHFAGLVMAALWLLSLFDVGKAVECTDTPLAASTVILFAMLFAVQFGLGYWAKAMDSK